MNFNSVKLTKCDFCKCFKPVVTEVNNCYFYSDCALEIFEHCIKNENYIKRSNNNNKQGK